MSVLQTALAKGLWGICIMGKIFGKRRNMVSLVVYSDIIKLLKNFFISYINLMILRVKSSSIVLHLECLRGIFLRENF